MGRKKKRVMTERVKGRKERDIDIDNKQKMIGT